jgi:DNA repair protein RadC
VVAVTAQEHHSGLSSLAKAAGRSGLPAARALVPASSPCLPQPKICGGWGKNFFKEEKMQDQEPLTVRPKRLSIPKPTFKPYGVPRYRLTLVAESSGLAPSGPIQTSVAAASLLRPCFDGLDREQFLVCGLDTKHRIIGINIVSIGSLTLAIVHPREVFKPLILMNAAAFICAHNHPSSDPTPSPEDRVLTRRLRQGAEILGITLLDHVVLGEERYFSFADQGWPVT